MTQRGSSEPEQTDPRARTARPPRSESPVWQGVEATAQVYLRACKRAARLLNRSRPK